MDEIEREIGDARCYTLEIDIRVPFFFMQALHFVHEVTSYFTLKVERLHSKKESRISIPYMFVGVQRDIRF